MKYVYFGLFVVALVTIVYVVGAAIGGAPAQTRLERFASADLADLDFASAGQPTPDADFYGADLAPLSLTDFAGRTILVNFWATWCGPCEREMPHLGALQKARGGEDFEVVAISVDAREDEDYARRRLDELSGHQIEFRFAPPDTYEVVYATGTRGFPTTILYGADGTEIARLEGEADWSSGHALAFIDAVLAGQAE